MWVSITVDQHVWVWLNKSNLTNILNSAFFQTTLAPSQLVPAAGFSLSTPYGEWGGFSEYFQEADQDPIR